jgi:hypothetical protein
MPCLACWRNKLGRKLDLCHVEQAQHRSARPAAVGITESEEPVHARLCAKPAAGPIWQISNAHLHKATQHTSMWSMRAASNVHWMQPGAGMPSQHSLHDGYCDTTAAGAQTACMCLHDTSQIVYGSRCSAWAKSSSLPMSAATNAPKNHNACRRPSQA